MQIDQKIPCPVCQTSIPFNTQQLMMGVQFSCSNCQSKIGLAVESQDKASAALKKFEEVKNKLGKG